MKIAFLFLNSFAVAVQTIATKCNADNCARAVTGLNRGQQSSHVADCRSFQQCSVQPPPTTVTEFTLIYTDDPGSSFPSSSPPPNPANTGTPVTSCPTAVPKYASACSGTQRYGSACSCAGATRSYTTGAPSTVTTTSTITSVTTHSSASPPPTTITSTPDQCTFGGGRPGGSCGCGYDGGCNYAFCQSSATATAFNADGCLQVCDDDLSCQGMAYHGDGPIDGACILCYGPVTVDELVNNNDQWAYRDGACTGPASASCVQPFG